MFLSNFEQWLLFFLEEYGEDARGPGSSPFFISGDLHPNLPPPWGSDLDAPVFWGLLMEAFHPHHDIGWGRRALGLVRFLTPRLQSPPVLRGSDFNHLATLPAVRRWVPEHAMTDC